MITYLKDKKSARRIILERAHFVIMGDLLFNLLDKKFKIKTIFNIVFYLTTKCFGYDKTFEDFIACFLTSRSVKEVDT